MSEEIKKEVKPGFFTTEMWLALVGGIIGPQGLLVFISAKLPPDSLAYVIISAFLASAAIVWQYIKSRTAVKTGSKPD